MKNFFAILGGMGTLATTNFLNEMNRRYHPDSDQGYLNYLLFNHATIPDRTQYILKKSVDNPAVSLIEDIRQVEPLKPDFMVIPCNTAHYFFEDLQAATDIPIVNMLDLVGRQLKILGSGKKVGLFATAGTAQSGLYEKVAKEAGWDLIVPDEALQKKITQLIYDDVKVRATANLELYENILQSFKDMGAETTILGCTEVSYVNSQDELKRFNIIDAEKLLVSETVKLGIRSQKEKKV
ncbi:amino acid racemase [Atopobacter sp. AH10]|uniref:aspartate/glutamate racemase family protein n=1 Tax=Atopobacter sp. AH10 TaxID=2315861 RepID=UPI000EF213A0|nr:amino acid racemase [Atopobacter sp. AH10]RLK62933.1 amino acid racemase [Atopobacter sp. AH10]